MRIKKRLVSAAVLPYTGFMQNNPQEEYKMPFINIHVTGTLDQAHKDALKTRLGQIVTILPNKHESGLMVDISDGHSMYFQGNQLDKCAFVDVRLYKQSPFEEKGQFVKALFEALEQIAGVPQNCVYLNFIELENWASRGGFR